MLGTDRAVDNLTFNLTQEIHVRSSIANTFAALLEEMGPANEGYGGVPMPMTLEAWPGGRWFRDLGDRNGHFWGHVQAIKRPTLLEITGPLMMSFAVVSNVQYRLSEVDGGVLLTLRHTAFGNIPDGYREGFTEGWTRMIEAIRRRAEKA
jgi:uncharacterized protein YndB with AHSA1/START domain